MNLPFSVVPLTLITTVKCIDMGMSYYPDYESVPSFLTRKIRKSFFPPSDEEKEWMHLGETLDLRHASVFLHSVNPFTSAPGRFIH